MAKRTTLVDRRILTLVVQGIPELSEEEVERHVKHTAHLHRVEDALLRADLTRVDVEAVIRLLQPELPEIRRFAPGVLDRVHTLGGRFSRAWITEVPGGETLESQRDNVIKFWSNWHFGAKEQTRLRVAPSLASQVVYLPELVEKSLGCTFDKVEIGRLSVQEILDSLPKVEGLRWTVGNAPMVCRVLGNHRGETSGYLLPGVYTWTTDEYEHPGYGLVRLLVGGFGSRGVVVDCLRPGDWRGDFGLFVLGVPE